VDGLEDTSPEDGNPEGEWQVAAQRDALARELYVALRDIARRHLAREAHPHTLRPTDLLGEAYVSLARSRKCWQDRTHFLAVASRAMRNILVDHARRKGRRKKLVMLDDVAAAPWKTVEVLALEEALQALAERSPEQAEALHLRHWAGFSTPEIALHLQISERTARGYVAAGRAFVRKMLLAS